MYLIGPVHFKKNPLPRNLVHQADISERNRLLIKLKITKSVCEGSFFLFSKSSCPVALVVEVIEATIY